jgi:hypothetical protein
MSPPRTPWRTKPTIEARGYGLPGYVPESWDIVDFHGQPVLYLVDRETARAIVDAVNANALLNLVFLPGLAEAGFNADVPKDVFVASVDDYAGNALCGFAFDVGLDLQLASPGGCIHFVQFGDGAAPRFGYCGDRNYPTWKEPCPDCGEMWWARGYKNSTPCDASQKCLNARIRPAVFVRDR